MIAIPAPAGLSAPAPWGTYVMLVMLGAGMVAWRLWVGGESGRSLMRRVLRPPGPEGPIRLQAVLSWGVGATGVVWLGAGLVGLLLKAIG